MTDLQSEPLVDELVETLADGDSIPDWIAKRCDGSIDTERLCRATRDLTSQLLQTDSPRVAYWERLFMALALRSAENEGQAAFEACAAAVDRLAELVETGQLDPVSHDDVVTLGSSMTLMLATQRKLHQRIEYAVGLLCIRHPASLAAMAQRCEDIWHRCGQMSGASSLFVWDGRREEWRLAQDFRPYRPEA